MNRKLSKPQNTIKISYRNVALIVILILIITTSIWEVISELQIVVYINASGFHENDTRLEGMDSVMNTAIMSHYIVYAYHFSLGSK